MRPSDWFLVDLSGDPTPGDAFGIRSVAARYDEIAAIAAEASDGVHRARSSGAASAWLGEAGDVFRDRSHRMPGELAKANDSYSVVARALAAWAAAVDDTQAQADRGLQQAREARADLASASAALHQAQESWSSVHAQQLTYQRLQKDYSSVPPPRNVTMPTDYQVRGNARQAVDAQSSMEAAQLRMADADARLAAARSLVLDAKARRDDAERATVHAISDARDRAVKPSSIWEAIQDSAAWQTIVQVATVVLTIVSIVAIFVGGPLVWALILAATILLVVNALLSIAQGKDAWGELAMLAVGLIPGGRLLGLALRGLEGMGRVGEAALRISKLASSIKSGASEGLQTVVRRLADETGEWRLLSLKRSLRWDQVKFSQRSVTYNKVDRLTHERYNYDDIVASMRKNGWLGEPIDVVDLDQHGIASLDNTRLLAAREANIRVEAVIHHPDEHLGFDEIKRFRTVGMPQPRTWGDAVYGRIADQWDGWGVENPHGTFETPFISGGSR